MIEQHGEDSERLLGNTAARSSPFAQLSCLKVKYEIFETDEMLAPDLSLHVAPLGGRILLPLSIPPHCSFGIQKYEIDSCFEISQL
jgi:hypothetical protein